MTTRCHARRTCDQMVCTKCDLAWDYNEPALECNPKGKTQRPMLEKDIESAVCEYAVSKGLLVYKFVSPNRIGPPDRMFVRLGGLIFFIEFKKPGGKVTPMQEREHERLRGHNVTVFVCDNVDFGKGIIDGMTE